MRNPVWSRDELIVALNFYFEHFPKFPDKASPEIKGLSENIRKIGEKIYTETPTDEKFRNQNGVYLKLMNFVALDPRYSGSGMSDVSKGDREVFEEFYENQESLKQVAKNILIVAESEYLQPRSSYDDTMTEAKEGRLLTRVHQMRERRTDLANAKKRSVLARDGVLICEVCGFDFFERYGERGRGFIECHHIEPLSQYEISKKTDFSDLALLCANCHRMIHSAQPWLSLDELRAILSGDKQEE